MGRGRRVREGELKDYLSRSRNTLPQTEVTNEINNEKTGSHVPFHRTQVIQTFTVVQFKYSSTEKIKGWEYTFLEIRNIRIRTYLKYSEAADAKFLSMLDEDMFENVELASTA